MKLEVENLSVRFRKRTILDKVSLHINSGEIVAVVGSNGSGKSTLCTALAGVSKNYGLSTEGSIKVDGAELSSLRVEERCKCLGMIFQNPDNYLFSQIVEDELSFAPENLCVPKEEIELRIREALSITGIEYLRNRRIQELSGGEKQLVAIASVITMKSNFIIADEITSRIDVEKCKKIRQVLNELKANNVGILMVTHNKKDLEIADRVYVLEEGRIYDRAN